MNTSIQSRLVMFASICVILCGMQSALAQQVQYYVHEFENVPGQDTSAIETYGINVNGVAYGKLRTDDGNRSFYYELVEDSAAPGGYIGQYHDLATFLNLPSDWVSHTCHQINNLGIGIGSVTLQSGDKKAFWFNLNDQPPLFQILPEPDVVGGASSYFPKHINDFGDIIVAFQNEIGSGEAYLFNPFSTEPPEYLLDDNGDTFEIDRSQPMSVTNDGVVIGLAGIPYGDKYVFAWSSEQGLTALTPPDPTQVLSQANNAGDFTGTWPTNRGWDAMTYDFETGQVNVFDNFTERGTAINDNGDVIVLSDHFEEAYLLRDGILIPFDDLVVGPNAQFFKDATDVTDYSRFGTGSLSNRNSTGYGFYTCRAIQTTTTGKGKKKTTTSVERRFILIPQQPAAGISVTPVDGLSTTEAGASDSFNVVLDSEPSADVTIGISSSNTDEGTVDQANLTFTPLNWDIPQTVTVSGVDDAIQDGDVAYTIVTAAATSNDQDYNGLNADDVSVTNEDDDGPPVGGSATFSSADTPLAIPDNNPGGVVSNILSGGHLITNLNVNVDITHRRPSDLEVYLIGPAGGGPVELFNFSGDNNVPEFNGTSSLGLWKLEVYDTRKKKKGTLNSWSITIDY